MSGGPIVPAVQGRVAAGATDKESLPVRLRPSGTRLPRVDSIALTYLFQLACLPLQNGDERPCQIGQPISRGRNILNTSPEGQKFMKLQTDNLYEIKACKSGRRKDNDRGGKKQFIYAMNVKSNGKSRFINLVSPERVLK
jgi:hypothetical protein